MKKLRLQVDALRVESFAPAAAAAERGTVRGEEMSGASCPYDCTLRGVTCDGLTCRCQNTLRCSEALNCV
jgi:hypothetical protein